MQIKFERRGGFAGRATNVEGTLTIDEHGAKVTSDTGNYQRDVPAGEAETLRAAADPARLKAAMGNVRPSRVRDAFQYQVTVTTPEGGKQTFTLLPGAGPDTQKLSDWVQEEVDRIWSHRINSR